MEFSLPRIGSCDLVSEIEKKRRKQAYAQKRKAGGRCLGTGSCDCRLCHSPS